MVKKISVFLGREHLRDISVSDEQWRSFTEIMSSFRLTIQHILNEKEKVILWDEKPTKEDIKDTLQEYGISIDEESLNRLYYTYGLELIQMHRIQFEILKAPHTP